MTAIIVLSAVILLLLVLNVTLFKKDYLVSRSMVIKRPPAEIYSKVVDLRSWPSWSPWLLHEPKAQIVYSEDPPTNKEGGHYSWDGKKVGSGKMTTLKVVENERIDQQIAFVKPFKSVCRVSWEFSAEDGGTNVTWTMDGSMPFFFRFMTSKIKHAIGKDYACGLKMLEQEVDPAAPKMVISFKGVGERPEMEIASSHWEGQLSDMPEVMRETFPKIYQAGKHEEGKMTGQPLTIYEKMDEKKGSVVLKMAVPIGKDQVEGFETMTLQGGKYHRTILQGDYAYLGHAWHSAFNNVRMSGAKYDCRRSPYEVYDNDPTAAESVDEYLTSIYIPVK